jgi:hypothetical protein
MQPGGLEHSSGMQEYMGFHLIRVRGDVLLHRDCISAPMDFIYPLSARTAHQVIIGALIYGTRNPFTFRVIDCVVVELFTLIIFSKQLVIQKSRFGKIVGCKAT